MSSPLPDPSSTPSVCTARSALFVPGDRPDRFAKAAASGADVVVVDLEDAVAPKHKDSAREHAAAWLSDEGRAVVRVNGTTTGFYQADTQVLAGLPGVLALMVPMAEDEAALSALAARVPCGVVALVETAVGLLHACDLAAAAGVVRLGLGHLDLAADLGCSSGQTAMLHARSTLVLASRSAGLVGPLEGITTVLDDPGLCADDARYAADLGFTGKLAIHPHQVPPINQAFAPSADELAWANRVLQLADTGQAVRLNGAMIDAPVVLRARTLLARVGEDAR